MGGSSKKVTVGYRYNVGEHLALCHGPVDSLREIKADNKSAWQGDFGGGRTYINAPGLFGGESREGGIQGDIDIEMGAPDQTPNDYLQSKVDSNIPAFKGVCCAVLRKVYMGLNPYLKPWSFKLQRVHKTQDGALQWYDEKSAIGFLTDEPLSIYFALDYSSSMNTISPNGKTRFENMRTAIHGVLDYIGMQINNGLLKKADIAISGFGTAPSTRSYAEEFDVDLSDIEVLKNSIPTSSPSYGTYFTAGVLDVNNFFTNANPDSKRIVIFLTDGFPFSSGMTPEEIAEEASTLLFSTSDLNSYAFNIDETDTTYTEYMDNTDSDGVPIIDGGDPTALYNAVLTSLSGQIDMNPAHIIRECLTNSDWGMGYQESDVDDISFTEVADTLFSEKMGISLLWSQETSIEEFIELIIKHINGVVYIDRSTGKFVLKLVRNNYESSSLLELTNLTNVIEVKDFARPQFGELINSVTVDYWDYTTEDTGSITVQDQALIQQQGAVLNTTLSYEGFTNPEIASKVAQRDLKTLSTPLATCTVLANRDAEVLTIGDVFKLTWPDFELDSVIMRVTAISYGNGKNNRVKIKCTEDVFTQPTTSIVSGQKPDDGWVAPGGPAEPTPFQLSYEAPYYEVVQILGQSGIDGRLEVDPSIGYMQTTAIRPNNGINAQLWVDDSSGYEEVEQLDFAPYCLLAVDLGFTETTATYTDGSDLDLVSTGSSFQIGNELLRIDSIDEETNTITFGRGILDTLPESHSTGDYCVFSDFYAVSDETEYVLSDSIDVKVLPNSNEGALDIDEATAETVVFDERAIRPYPPGNFRINNIPFKEAVGVDDTVEITWAHRDRLAQTAGDYEDQADGDIGPEIGTTYNINIDKTLSDGQVLNNSQTGIVGTSYTIDNSDIPPSGNIYCASFDGASNIDFGNPTQLQLSSDFEIEIKGVVSTQTSNNASMVSKYATSGNNRSYDMVRLSDGRANTVLSRNGLFGSTSSKSYTVNTPLIGSKDDFKITFVSGVLKIFLNGLEIPAGDISKSTDASFTSVYNALVNLKIGSRSDNIDYFQGCLDSVKITSAGVVVLDFNPALYGDLIDHSIFAHPSTNNGVQLIATPVASLKVTKYEIELESERDGYTSFNKYEHTVETAGYGLSYGKYYGGV